MKKKRIAFRIFSGNRLTMPLLLNVWETNGLDRHFEIFFAAGEPGRLTAGQVADLKTSDICVFSFMTPHLPLFAAEIKRLRSAGKTPPRFALGGSHASGEQDLARACGFDILFSGPGEETFLRFAHDLLGDKIKPGGDPLFYEAPPATTADAGSGPTWERYIPVSRYFKTVPPLEITRGCFWNCRYCQTGGSRPRHRGEDSIRSYLEELRRRGFPRAGFIAPSAFEYGAGRRGRPDLGCIERLLELCRLSGFPRVEFGIFPSEIRPDTVQAEGLRLLRRHTANRRLTFGAQSALDERLTQIGRGHTVSQIASAVAAANAAGFVVNLDFIIALPGETVRERRELLAFMAALRKKNRVHIQLHHFFPLAGSAFSRCLPSFLSPRERRLFTALKNNGLASDWWQEGERSVLAYLAWLERDFPDIFAQFT